MTQKTIEVDIAQIRLSIPIIDDTETTLNIVKIVNQRLKEIESKSSRIDTQAFALLAAISFAAELESLKDDKNNETRELLTILDAISQHIKELYDEFSSLGEE